MSLGRWLWRCLGWVLFILLLGVAGRNSLLVSRGGALFSWLLEPKPDNVRDRSLCWALKPASLWLQLSSEHDFSGGSAWAALPGALSPAAVWMMPRTFFLSCAWPHPAGFGLRGAPRALGCRRLGALRAGDHLSC